MAQSPGMWRANTIRFEGRMQDLGLTNKEVADRALISSAYVRLVKDGKRACSERVADRICRALETGSREAIFHKVGEADLEEDKEGVGMSGGKTLKFNPWTDDEDRYMMGHWDKEHHREIARHLGRTVGACEQRRYKLLEAQQKNREERILNAVVRMELGQDEQREPAKIRTGDILGLPFNQLAQGSAGIRLEPVTRSEERVMRGEDERSSPKEAAPKEAAPNGAVPFSYTAERATLPTSDDPVERRLLIMLELHRFLKGLDDSDRQMVLAWALDQYVGAKQHLLDRARVMR